MEPWDYLPSVFSQDQSFSASLGLCVVCGKSAAGHHYGVETCHGCKSFFRRATLNNIRYPSCVRNQNCYESISPEKPPTKCHHCRIKKCFDVGMISQVQPIRKINTALINFNGNNCRSLTQDESICGIIDRLTHLEMQIEVFRKSAYNPVVFPCLDETLQSIPCLSLGQTYGPMQGWPLTVEEFSIKQLLLRDSYQTLILQNSNLSLNVKNWLSFDLVATIEYAKTFNFFHYLSHNDKRLLTQATALMNYELMRVFESFSNKYEDIHHPDGTSSFERVCATVRNRHMAEQVRKISEKTMEKIIRERVEKQEYKTAEY